MCDISAFYNKPKYLPFLIYCREHHYKTMDDLVRCPFHLLIKEPGFTSILVSRVKAMYLIYCKTEKGENNLPESPEPIHKQNGQPIAAKAVSAAPAVPAAPKVLREPDLVILLHDYFKKNGDRLITIDDACKAAGGRVKRAEITKILQNVAWCQIVDKGTFFYAPIK